MRGPLITGVATAALLGAAVPALAETPSPSPSPDPAVILLSVGLDSHGVKAGGSVSGSVRVVASGGTLQGVHVSISATKPGVLSSSCAGGCSLGAVSGSESVSATVSVPESVSKATTVYLNVTVDASNAPAVSRGAAIDVTPRPAPTPTPTPTPTHKATPTPSPSAATQAPAVQGPAAGAAAPAVPAVRAPGAAAPLPVLAAAQIPADTVALPPVASPLNASAESAVAGPQTRLVAARIEADPVAVVARAQAAWLLALLVSVGVILVRLRLRQAPAARR